MEEEQAVRVEWQGSQQFTLEVPSIVEGKVEERPDGRQKMRALVFSPPLDWDRVEGAATRSHVLSRREWKFVQSLDLVGDKKLREVVDRSTEPEQASRNVQPRF